MNRVAKCLKLASGPADLDSDWTVLKHNELICRIGLFVKDVSVQKYTKFFLLLLKVCHSTKSLSPLSRNNFLRLHNWDWGKWSLFETLTVNCKNMSLCCWGWSICRTWVVPKHSGLSKPTCFVLACIIGVSELINHPSHCSKNFISRLKGSLSQP